MSGMHITSRSTLHPWRQLPWHLRHQQSVNYSYVHPMFDLSIDDGAARIIRNALQQYRKNWSGGRPQEQIDIEFLETQFNRMVLEAELDA